ncbi:MAG: hypothetical protein R3258_04410 [Acidimicrobiia bacterium]|nr:hypothetical protein [Acidimicrobiia bacterium]
MSKGINAEILKRAGKRAAVHLIQALVEGLKAVEAVIDELGAATRGDNEDMKTTRHKIDVE